jgi:hypothetical protein
MKIPYVASKYDYGQPEQGWSFELPPTLCEHACGSGFATIFKQMGLHCQPIAKKLSSC